MRLYIYTYFSFFYFTHEDARLIEIKSLNLEITVLYWEVHRL